MPRATQLPPDPSLPARLRINLDEHGWLVLPDVLDRRAVGAMREAFELAAAAQKEAGAREGGTRYVALDDASFGVAKGEPRVLEAAQTAKDLAAEAAS